LYKLSHLGEVSTSYFTPYTLMDPPQFRKITGSSHCVCLFVCLESHEQFFSYLATVTIAGNTHRAANLDLCLALTAFSSEGSFTCHIYCDTGPPFLRSYPKDPWFYLLNAVLLAKEQSLPILNVLGLTWPTRAGLELMTYPLLSESTTTRLPPIVVIRTSTNDNKALNKVSSLSSKLLIGHLGKEVSTSYFTPSTPLGSTITHNWILSFR
jgi:hypothetical protein